jgi:uncharacterized caspase-like protein
MRTAAGMRPEGRRPFLPHLLGLVLLALLAGMPAAVAQGNGTQGNGTQGNGTQGKRLGLVVGFADYGEIKHPTALQDAGLVAQSLRQAGFELMEAANLTQSEFRAMFRDFTERAGAAGPESTIAVYLSGIALQDDGENILLPVGTRMRQRADLALEGLRVSDFLRALSALPASARIVMLDAAYSHPLGQIVAESGGGLAPVERRDGLVVSFNQSPDQVATLPRTNYSHYAMALAEALREPGLDLVAVLERVRLRVHDLSQGAETPWAVNGLTAPLVLLPGTASAPAPVPSTEMIAARRKPIAQLNAEDAYSRAIELDTIPVYEEFLKAYPTHVQARRVRAMIAARREAYTWQRARRTNTDRAYWTYLRRYPNGAHAAEAESRLARLAAPLVPPPQFEEVIYDDLPPPLPEEREIYETVVIENRWGTLPPPGGYYDRFLPPPPVEIIELAPPPPNPSARLLPAVVIGAGVVGAAILANRAWRRPEAVRPPVSPPVARPPRVPGQYGFQQPVRPPLGQPAPAQPVTGQIVPTQVVPTQPRPPVGTVLNPPALTPGGVRPAGLPPVAPPAGQPPAGFPGAIRQPPAGPGSGPPATLPPRPGAIMPPAGGVPNTAHPLARGQVPGVQVPGGQVPGGQVPGVQVPGAQAPGGQGPGARVPVQSPLASPPPTAVPSAGTPPAGAKPVRQVPLTQQQPYPVRSPAAQPSLVRPPVAQPAPIRPPAAQPAAPPRFMPVPQRPAPEVRQGPVPQYRNAPPPRPASPPPQLAPPPQARPAPPPQVHPAPAARPCTPQMQAARQC